MTLVKIGGDVFRHRIFMLFQGVKITVAHFGGNLVANVN